MHRHFLWLVPLGILLGTSCSLSKHLPPGAKLYEGSTVAVKKKAKVTAETGALELRMTGVLPPPNRSLLGIKWRMWAYLLLDNDKKKGILYGLRDQFGEAPVLFDPENLQNVELLLSNRAHNAGFFEHTISHTLDSSDTRVTVDYEALVGRAYRIDTFRTEIDNPRVARELATLMRDTRIKPGTRYQLGELKNERLRLEIALKRRGYYFVEGNDFKFIADTTRLDRGVELVMQLKNDVPERHLRPFAVDAIVVRPDFELTTSDPNPAPLDTLRAPEATYIFRDMAVRQQTLDQSILIEPGETYSVKDHENTLKRLVNLNTYKFVNLELDQTPGSDSTLTVNVDLTPKIKRTINGSVGLTVRSNDFIGPEFNVGYTNRNLFGGAETLRLNLDGTLAFFSGETLTDSAALFNYYEDLSLSGTISKPGLYIPFYRGNFSNDLIANTNFSLSMSRQRYRLALRPQLINQFDIESLRPLDPVEQMFLNDLIPLRDASLNPGGDAYFALNSITGKYGFTWQRRPDYEHALNPISLYFQLPFYENEDVEFIILLETFLNQAQRQALTLQKLAQLKADYVVTHDSRKIQLRHDNYFFRSRVALATNQAFPSTNALITTEQTNSVYAQLENDFRYYARFDSKNTVATRLVTKSAVPITNIAILPIFDQYTVGGPNSIRAFRIRQVGPGTYFDPEVNSSILGGYGDIQLEGSIEYRYTFSEFIELATFLDFGNVWLLNEDPNLPGAEFDFNDFYRELAVGTGLGARFNLGFLLVRTDIGIPVTRPFLPEGERVVIQNFAPFDKDWRRDNVVFHLGFGYPF